MAVIKVPGSQELNQGVQESLRGSPGGRFPGQEEGSALEKEALGVNSQSPPAESWVWKGAEGLISGEHALSTAGPWMAVGLWAGLESPGTFFLPSLGLRQAAFASFLPCSNSGSWTGALLRTLECL